ncbi:MAG: hypothetical protein V4643_10755 [Bacteroidota bacterium]
MKYVFNSSSEVAHLFANQLQDNAKYSGGNFYFSGNTIYSYGSHFPIARHVTNDKGEKALLFTERTYSNTTAKHLSIVRQAVRHLNVIDCFRPDNTKEDNFKYWEREIAEEIAPKLLKAKKPEIYLSQIETVKNKATKYAAFFEVEIPESLQSAFAITNREQYAAFKENKEAYELAAKKKAQKELAKHHKKELAKWQKLEINRLYTHSGFDFLRLNNGRIETTQAVEIPLELGLRLYNKVKTGTLKVGEKVLNYEVQEVGKVVKIGCHTFKNDYLLKFGQQLQTS